MKGISLALFWAAGAIGTAQTPEDPEALLERIRAVAETNLNRLPDYICLQTVERTRREAPDEEYHPVDTIRLEVGLADDRELFAWPNSARFGENEISDLIQHGVVGNGQFALHARNVFLTDAPSVSPQGTEALDGRTAHRYDFEVPLERSTYRLRVPPVQALVPFHGSFWVDAENLDLIRLSVVADDIPAELRLVEARTRIDYARVPIGGAHFLLPAAAQLDMLGAAGDANRNVTTFGACRQYVGEASISFDSRAPALETPGAGPGAQPSFRLPPHVTLELALDSEIDSRRAVVGDPVRAVLTKPVMDGKQVLVPKGAAVHGRLVRLDRYDQPVGHYVVALEFNRLDLPDQPALFTATMRQATGSPAIFKPAKTLDPTFSKRRRKPFLEVLVNESQPGQGIIHWKAEKPVISGLKMLWEVEPER